jgi:outer membrane protein
MSFFHKFPIYLVIIVLSISNASTQSILKLDEAINIALKNNHDLKLSEYNIKIAQLNNTRANAGMMPRLNLFGTDNIESGYLYQKYSDGEKNNYPFLASNSLNSGIDLNWKLYAGGIMKLQKNKLGEFENLSQSFLANYRQLIISNVLNSYYEIIRQQQQLKALNEIISFNSERVKISEAAFIAGTVPKTEVLQSKIDLNLSLESAINQEYMIILSKSTLNTLIGRDENPDFEIDESINFISIENDEKKLLNKLESNTELSILKIKIKIAQLSLSQAEKLKYPTIDLNGNLAYTQLNNSAESLRSSSTVGPSAGIKITYPLYSAGENKRKLEIAKVELTISETELAKTKMLLNTQLQMHLFNYNNQLKQLKFEEENNNLARENLKISIERLRLGQSNSLEVHQSQEYLMQSNTRLINIKYLLKLAETKMRQLIGDL